MASASPPGEGLPSKKPKIQSLDIWNKTVIITTAKVDQGDVYSYLKKRVRDKDFAEGSIFKIYAGAHGYSNGRLGDRKSDHNQLELDIESQIQSALEDASVCDEKTHEEIEKLHGQLAETNRERILEIIESKLLVWHIRQAVLKLKTKESPESAIIKQMKYRLHNPDEVGKESKDEGLEYYHEDMLEEVFENMIYSPKPYVIFLAFCLSEVNELTKYMRELGVISACTMKNDIGEITSGRWFLLNEDQAEVMKQVQDYHKYKEVEKGKHVLLCGGPGTGKTILLAELFKMRVEHCKRMMKKGDRPLKIIIVVMCSQQSDPLFEKTKNEYFANLKEGTDEQGNEVEFLVNVEWWNVRLEWRFSDPLEGCALERSGPGMLRHVARKVSCPDMWSKTLIFIDEFRLVIDSDKIQNLRSVFDDVVNDVDFFVATSPWVGDTGNLKFNLALPEQTTVLAKQLYHKHRNGMKIQHLLQHIGENFSNAVLDDQHDVIAKTIPDSEITLWISLDSYFPFPLVLSLIENKFIRCDQKVTLVSTTSNFMMTAHQWCEKDEKRTFVNPYISSTISKGDSFAFNLSGCEDDVMIFLNCPPLSAQELFSRARQRLIIVTTPDGEGGSLDRKWERLFESSGLT